MSDFLNMLVDMLPVSSAIQNPANDFRKVLDKTVGEYMDNQDDIFDELFLTSATGGWLDAFGKDFGVSRKLDEDDEAYRQRIIFEKLEYLTARNLQTIYDILLYAYVPNYNIPNNQLTSDNPYISDKYMSYASEELQNILNKKFVLGDEIEWL